MSTCPTPTPFTPKLWLLAQPASLRRTPPLDGDRAATIKDPFGNTWFLATYLGEPGT